MPVSSIKATFDCDIQKIWDVVTDVRNYPAWRSDLSKTEILNEYQFIEYTKSGYATTFTITLTKPYKRWEFDMDNSNMNGHWVGTFSQDGDITTITFTEDITAKKWFLKPFVHSYLRKQQEQFIADLKKITEKSEINMDTTYIVNFYNNYDEDNRLTLRHGSVEFLTTMKYIEKYLKPNSKIIEIGAGTGRYSHALARQGYVVDAVELVEHNIEVFKKNTLPNESITVRQGNAVDLSEFGDNQYDITLLLGPLYHLYDKEDKCQALSEAIRVTKPGGVIFAAYVLSDGCLLDEGFHRGKFNVKEYIRDGLIDSETFTTKSEPKDLFELVRKEDIDDLMSAFSVTRLHYAATDGCALFMREAIDAMDDETFQLYLKYHFSICEREDLLGVSSHAVDIFRKNPV